MTDREICEQIVKDGDCTSALSCKNCPLESGEWECGGTRDEIVRQAKRWLEDHPEQNGGQTINKEIFEKLVNSTPTLRDQFAMSALNGLICRRPDVVCSIDGYAIDAYMYADAMIKARVGNRIKEEEAK